MVSIPHGLAVVLPRLNIGVCLLLTFGSCVKQIGQMNSAHVMERMRVVLRWFVCVRRTGRVCVEGDLALSHLVVADGTTDPQ